MVTKGLFDDDDDDLATIAPPAPAAAQAKPAKAVRLCVFAWRCGPCMPTLLPSAHFTSHGTWQSSLFEDDDEEAVIAPKAVPKAAAAPAKSSVR
jgi:hypothetical protein